MLILLSIRSQARYVYLLYKMLLIDEGRYIVCLRTGYVLVQTK